MCDLDSSSSTYDLHPLLSAIPSGVGFLGAGLIIKSTEKDPVTGDSHHLVQGITTAAATWLSAAVGLACGGGLYFIACFSTAVNLVLLRFGPRLTDVVEETYFPESPDNLQDMKMRNFDRESGKPYYESANEKSPLTHSRDVSDYQREVLTASARASARSRPSLM